MTATAYLVRVTKVIMVAAVALIMSLISFTNITDYQVNYEYVQHVLSMDTTFRHDAVMWRSISSSTLKHTAYVFIISCELSCALICWVGAFKCSKHLRNSAPDFNRSKNVAVFGLMIGAMLWLVGFLVIGGEWFLMWQSSAWNGQGSATRMFFITMLILMFLVGEDRATGDSD